MATKAQLQQEIDALRRDLGQPIVQAVLAHDWETVRELILQQAPEMTSVEQVMALVRAARRNHG